MDHHDDLEQTARTRRAYDLLAPVWAATTDDGPYNAGLERPALRGLVPRPLAAARVLDAGCGAGAQCAWLLDEGAEVVGVDLSPRMVDVAVERCGGRGRFAVADLADPLPVEPASLDGITSSLALHYLRDWSAPLRAFATALRPGGWVVLSVEHPFAPALPGQGARCSVQPVTDTWHKGGVEVTQRFFRRTLPAAFDAFAAAGFVVDRVAEAKPDAAALVRWPELAALVDVPTFIVYRLRLLAAGPAAPQPGRA